MDQSLLKQQVLEACHKHRAEFSQITGGFEDRGILNSEMLAVCSLAEELEIEVFIESGRWLGQSTEILARYFDGKPVIIESIEAFYDENALHVEKKLAGKRHLNLLYGDANTVVPQLIRKYRGKRVALLFDGPKGGAALDIFRAALIASDTVKVGFFHDMRQSTPDMPNASRGEMQAVFPEAFYTDDRDFVRAFESLDAGCDTALWRPYAIDDKTIGSYGPTIGIIIPDVSDRQRARQQRWAIYARMSRQALMLVIVKLGQAIRRLIRF